MGVKGSGQESKAAAGRIAWSDRLTAQVRAGLAGVEDHRRGRVTIPLVEVLMSGYALFALKDPSLLAFEIRRRESASRENLRAIYGIEQIPSDTQLRQVLDGVDPARLRPLLSEVMGTVLRQKGLRAHRVLEKYYVVALDGVEHFRSEKVHCEQCTVSYHGSEGVAQYSHRLLVAALVAPGQRTVLPLEAEAVVRQDGSAKNDCEQQAAQRLLPRLRQSYRRLSLLLTGDALFATVPLIEMARRHDYAFLLKVKPGSHSTLCEAATRSPQRQGIEVSPPPGDQTSAPRRYTYTPECALTASHPDCRVTFMDEWQWDQSQQEWYCIGSWVTNLPVSDQTLLPLVQVARAHWKIENETFNTLKNQGYQFAHNFGHGHHHLASVLALLMLLAFAVDQAQQMLCPYFNAALTALADNKARLWERLRHLFYTLPLQRLSQIWRAIAFGFTVHTVSFGNFPALDSS